MAGLERTLAEVARTGFCIGVIEAETIVFFLVGSCHFWVGNLEFRFGALGFGA